MFKSHGEYLGSFVRVYRTLFLPNSLVLISGLILDYSEIAADSRASTPAEDALCSDTLIFKSPAGLEPTLVSL